MTSRPPPAIEGIVRLLLPPTCREHVSGDLSERYRSLGRYLMDSVGVLPFIIASQIRRTTNWPMVALGALILCGLLHTGGKPWLVAAIPAFLGMAALVLRDAYRAPQPPPGADKGDEGVSAGIDALGQPGQLAPGWLIRGRTLPKRHSRRAASDVVVVAVVVVLCQALTWMVAPEWLVQRASLTIGLPLFCVVWFFGRLKIQPSAGPARLAREMSATELLAEVRGFETLCQRNILIELGAALVLLAVCLPVLLAPVPLVLRSADALYVAGTLFVVWFLRRYANVTPLPDGLRFDQSLSGYRRHLEQQARLTGTVLWWYVLPLMLGPITLAFARALQAPGPWLPLSRAAAGQAIFMALVVWMNNRAHAQLQRRMNQLAALQEKS
jgi:hypothetical protein